MISSVIHYACYLTIFSLCVDEGHGRWKHMNREEIDHKIAALKLMADKLKHEIDDYYYDDSNLEQKSVHYIKQEKIDRSYEDSKTKNTYFAIFLKVPKILNNTSASSKDKNKVKNNAVENVEIGNEGATETVEVPKKKSGFVSKSRTDETRWPRFEEMLLAMGKKYDWKNDRWIKIKREYKQEGISVASNYVHKLDFLSKHKFSYKTVKLNSVKTKRNIVIAVTAIR